MAETIRGSLVVISTKKGQSLLVTFPTKKGTSQPTQILQGHLHPDLVAESQRNLSGLNNREVDLELEGGQPRRIRPVGVSWTLTQSASPTSKPEKSSPNQVKVNQPAVEQTAPGKKKISPPGQFHNPYNFIPAIPRDKIKDNLELSDRSPKGHDCYYDDCWSGYITVILTTITPLLIPHAAELKENQNKHKVYPLRYVNNKPYLPPTSIKGMLRSAYEAITNSRLGIFEKHSETLGYRMEPERNPLGCRVERNGKGQLAVKIMKRIAKLRRYRVGENLPEDKGESTAGLKYSSGELPQHGDRVWVQVDKYWKVLTIEPRNKNDDEPTTEENGSKWYEGWVCITGANFDNKSYERVFIESDNDRTIILSEENINQWKKLILNYQELHRKELDERLEAGIGYQEYKGSEPGQQGWSRHIYRCDEVELKEGQLCYIQLSGEKITELRPVMITRRFYQKDPASLLPDEIKPVSHLDKVKFAEKLKKLSPADRVFGWVNQKGIGAYKGQLRISSVECLLEKEEAILEFGETGLPLAILAEPKPEQVRFYSAENSQGEPLEIGTPKPDGYKNNQQGLRGRKVYPHHQGLPPGYWDNPIEDRTSQAVNGHYQEYRRPSGIQERDSQNRSIQAWVKPEVKFKFEIHITNLSNVELGALLCLLQMPEGNYHRLGGGKPLGFGSVKLELDLDNTDLRRGQQWQEFYKSLTAKVPAFTQADSCMGAYRKAVEEAYGSEFLQVPFIKAFFKAAKGFDDGKPIHYPRTQKQPDPEGENFKWFEENERGTELNGRKVEGAKLSLPFLVKDGGLPFHPIQPN